MSKAVTSAGPGDPLPLDLAEKFGSALHLGISNIRVHTGGYAQRLTSALGASAATIGRDIFFSSGRFDATSNGGRSLIGHELHHVAHPLAEGASPSAGIDAEHEADSFAKPSPITAASYSQRPSQEVSTPANGPPMLKRSPTATESIGGGGSVTFVPGPKGDENETLAIGEQGATRRALPLVTAAATASLANYMDALLSPVGSPDFSKLEVDIDRYSDSATEADREAEGTTIWGKPSPFFEDMYKGQAKWYRDRVELLISHRVEEESICAGFNAFVARGNLLFQSLARLEGIQNLFGVSDPSAMVAALIDSLDDAHRTAERAQISSPGSLDPPATDQKVGEAAADVSSAATDMSIKWMGFRQVLSTRNVEKLAASAADKEAELQEINQIISTWKEIGATVDLSLDIIGGAKKLESAASASEGWDAAKGLGSTAAGSVGIPTDVAGLAEGITGLVFEDEIRAIEDALTSLRTKMSAEAAVAEQLGAAQKMKEFEAAKDKFKLASRQLVDRMHARQMAYLKLGEQLDQAAQQDPELRRGGVAPAKGQERFSTVFLLTTAVPEVLAIGRSSMTAFDSPDELRDRYLAITSTRALFPPEYTPLVSIHSQISTYHSNVATLEEVLGPVDAKAKVVMAALQGEGRPGSDPGAY